MEKMLKLSFDRLILCRFFICGYRYLHN